MSETPAGPMATVVSDGFVVSSNRGTAEEIEANLKSEAKPKDGEPEDPKEVEAKETKAAAAKLGKKGGEAAAKARAKEAKAEKPEPVQAAVEFEDDEDEPGPDKKPAKEPEPGEDDVKAGNPRHDAKARIAQLAREKNEERSKREALEARLAKLEAERTAKPAEKEPEKAAAPKKPTPDDYGTYEEYVEALADHKADERIRKMRQEDDDRRAVERAVEHVKKRGETFRERIFAAEKADPALKERLSAPEAVELLKELAPSWSVPPGTPMKAINAISDAIIDSEQAAQLLVYLAEDPDMMDRLRSLPDHAAVMRAIGRLEGTMVSQGAAPEPAPAPRAVQPVSQAKPPVRPISGAPAAGEDDPDAEDDFDAYKRKADARDARLRRVR